MAEEPTRAPAVTAGDSPSGKEDDVNNGEQLDTSATNETVHQTALQATGPDDGCLKPKIEQEKEQRIARNRAMMLQFGVLEEVKRCQQMGSVPKKPRSAKTPKTEQAPMQPIDRPRRFSDKERPNYKESSTKLYVLEEREPRRHRSSTTARKPRATGGNEAEFVHEFLAWHPWMPQPPQAAINAARAAAEARKAELERQGKPVLAKVLKRSMVSGGFWFASNKKAALDDHLDAGFVMFECKDDTVELPKQPGEFYKGDHKWQVVFLQTQDGNHGFSGGWRAFAAHQFLHEHDAVVLTPTSRSELQVQIYRAWDFAAPEDCPADLQAVRFKRITAQEVQEKEEQGAGSKQRGTQSGKAAAADGAGGGSAGDGGPRQGAISASAAARSSKTKSKQPTKQVQAAGARGQKKGNGSSTQKAAAGRKRARAEAATASADASVRVSKRRR